MAKKAAKKKVVKKDPKKIAKQIAGKDGKLNPTVKTKWLSALRSDKYIQGQEQLCQLNSDKKEMHCCLGVLCEVLIGMGVPLKKKKTNSEGSFVFHYKNDGGYGGNIPAGLREQVGFSSEVEESLISLNDDKDKSFKQIAQKIEKIL
jgi:hypothetical protein